MFYQIKLSGIIKSMYSNCGLGFIVLVVVVSSCSPALKFSSVKYDAASINKLLDSSSSMNYLTLIYNSADASSSKNAFGLISYARNATGGYIDVPPYYLMPAEGKARTFKGKLILANLTLGRDSIVALLKDPKTGEMIKNFEYLLFKPVLDPVYNYMYYDIKVVAKDSAANSTESVKVATRPCPPAVGCRPSGGR